MPKFEKRLNGYDCFTHYIFMSSWREIHNMIPVVIKKVHICKAMQRIAVDGFPTRRKSRDYCLAADGRCFPPKYTIALAHEIATGNLLDSEEFSGGDESERFLKDHGFDVIECKCGGYHRDARSESMAQQDLSRQDVGPDGDRSRRASDSSGAIIRHTSGQTESTLRVALVFPSLESGPPDADAFKGEKIDFVLFPEGYVDSSDETLKKLKRLASKLGAPLLVGAGDEEQTLLRFNPDGSEPFLLYTKHSTADVIAFEKDDWNPRDCLSTFELGGVKAGATICHDHYLGMLQRYLYKNGGARLWLNPSGTNVLDAKWASVLRLRAVENRLFALCTLHVDQSKRTHTHPFAFSPDGNELCARKAGSADSQLISDCTEADVVYIVDLDTASAGKSIGWSNLPCASKAQRQNKNPQKPVRVSLENGQPMVYARRRWRNSADDRCIQTEHGGVYVGVIRGKRILDAAARFCVIDRAHDMDCRPIIWNHWNRLPTDSDRLANLMMGMAIECCAPIIVSDKYGIHELVELSNCNKIPVRRIVKRSEPAVVDVGRAWGLPSALKMATENTSEAYNLYRSLAK